MAAKAEPFAVVGATLIDGTGRPPIPNAVILVDGSRIVAGGPASRVPIPQGSKRINAAGKFVIPGLMDANVHLLLDIEAEYLIKAEGGYEPLIEEAAQIALRGGLTTVFDTWGPRQALTKVRGEIAKGKVTGSRIFLGGNIIGFGGPMSADFVPAARDVISKALADTIDEAWEQGVGPELLSLAAEDVGAKVRAYVSSGSVNFLKYGSSGHVQENMIAFSPHAQRAIVAEARRAGLTAQAHTTSIESLRMAIDAGVDLLQHCDVTGSVAIPEGLINRLVTGKVPCAALLRTRRYLEWAAAQPTSANHDRTRVKAINDKNLIKAGATLLLSTDAGVYGPNIQSSPFSSIVAGPDVLTRLGDGHFLWLEAAIEQGMDPMQALLAATRNIARAYKVDDHVGTVEPGKIADFLILEANPLKDPRNYRRIAMVFKDGRAVDRNSLPLRPIMTRAQAQKPGGAATDPPPLHAPAPIP